MKKWIKNILVLIMIAALILVLIRKISLSSVSLIMLNCFAIFACLECLESNFLQLKSLFLFTVIGYIVIIIAGLIKMVMENDYSLDIRTIMVLLVMSVAFKINPLCSWVKKQNNKE